MALSNCRAAPSISTRQPAPSVVRLWWTRPAATAETVRATARCTGKCWKATAIREVTFLPDRVDGKVAPQGKSTIQVHGSFGVHGATHEIVIPVQVAMASGGWTAHAHFTIPYIQWGLKNPSTFILHVSKTVDIDVQASGGISAPTK